MDDVAVSNASGRRPIVKAQPADFVVHEIPLISDAAGWSSESPDELGRPFEVALTKCGLTTFEALGVLASRWGLQSSDISYAGLKDEDGVTTQLLTVVAGSSEGLEVAWREGARWLSTKVRDRVEQHKQVGELFGNSFRIVVRQLPIGSRLPHRFTLPVINYYDTQRFGVPGGPLLTDRIGESLLFDRFDEALELVAQSKIPESRSAAAHSGDPRAFFEGIDQRVSAFWLSAYYSAQWNQELAALLHGIETDEVTRRGRPYVFPKPEHQSSIHRHLPLELEYSTARSTSEGIVVTRRPRPCILLTSFFASEPERDDLFADSHKLSLQFNLPTGAYATMAVFQALRAHGLWDGADHEVVER